MHTLLARQSGSLVWKHCLRMARSGSRVIVEISGFMRRRNVPVNLGQSACSGFARTSCGQTCAQIVTLARFLQLVLQTALTAHTYCHYIARAHLCHRAITTMRRANRDVWMFQPARIKCYQVRRACTLQHNWLLLQAKLAAAIALLADTLAGAVDRLPCNSGNYNSAPRQSSCLPCSLGTHQPRRGFHKG